MFVCDMMYILFCDEIVTDVATLWMYCLSLLTSAYQGVPLPNWTWHASQLSNGWWHHVLQRISLVFMILPGQWETNSHQFGRLFRTASFSFSLKAFIWHLIITPLHFGQMPIGFYRRVALDFPAGLTFTTEFLGLTFIASSVRPKFLNILLHTTGGRNFVFNLTWRHWNISSEQI